MDLKRKPECDVMFGLYSVLLAMVWAVTVAHRPLALGMTAVHLGLAWLLFILPAPAGKAPAAAVVARRFYPFLLWGLAWSEVGWLYRLKLPVTWDDPIQTLDLLATGTHLNLKLAGWLPWPWLSELMHGLYLSYYLLILGPVVYLVWRRRDQLEGHTANLMGTYLACFSVYLVLPVLGPRGFGNEVAISRGVFAGVMEAFFAAGDSLGTAFPSSHCAASLAAALSARAFLGPKTSGVLLVWALMIAVATVYTNNHYAIDGITGLGLALGVWKLRSWRLAQQERVGLLARAFGSSAGMVVGAKMGSEKGRDAS
jgi:membrane-associated phospholipid phosphatase